MDVNNSQPALFVASVQGYDSYMLLCYRALG